MAFNNTRASRQKLSQKYAKIRQATSTLSSQVQVLKQQLQAAELRAKDAQVRAQHCEERILATQEMLKDANSGRFDAELRAQQCEERTQATQTILEETNYQCDLTERRLTETIRQTEQQLHELRDDYDGRQHRCEELTVDLGRMRDRAQFSEQRVASLETQWIIDHREIEMTDRELGGGGWGFVRVDVPGNQSGSKITS